MFKVPCKFAKVLYHGQSQIVKITAFSFYTQDLVKIREEVVRKSFNRPDAFIEENLSDGDEEFQGECWICLLQVDNMIQHLKIWTWLYNDTTSDHIDSSSLQLTWIIECVLMNYES